MKDREGRDRDEEEIEVDRRGLACFVNFTQGGDVLRRPDQSQFC